MYVNNGNSDIDNSVKNRKIFTDQHLIAGIPANLFVIGLVVTVLPILLFKSASLCFVFAVIYYGFMIPLHKDDPKALGVWLSCFSDKFVYWESGRCKKNTLIIDTRK